MIVWHWRLLLKIQLCHHRNTFHFKIYICFIWNNISLYYCICFLYFKAFVSMRRLLKTLKFLNITNFLVHGSLWKFCQQNNKVFWKTPFLQACMFHFVWMELRHYFHLKISKPWHLVFLPFSFFFLFLTDCQTAYVGLCVKMKWTVTQAPVLFGSCWALL